jgi:D-glycerate 3-kinase
MRSTLQALTHSTGSVAVPRFDKAQDDRLPADRWTQVEAPLDVVIVEGWCLGARAQPQEALATAVNELEQKEDPDGTWRGHVNRQLERHYHGLYDLVDVWIMLQAPSFDSVYQWRLEQEQKLTETTAQAGPRIMSPRQIARFIQHYQRLTEQALRTLPQQVHYLFRLDEQRRIIESTHPRAVNIRPAAQVDEQGPA